MVSVTRVATNFQTKVAQRFLKTSFLIWSVLDTFWQLLVKIWLLFAQTSAHSARGAYVLIFVITFTNLLKYGMMQFKIEPLSRSTWELISTQEVRCCVYKVVIQWRQCMKDNNQICLTAVANLITILRS